jgi:hypothetical protein
MSVYNFDITDASFERPPHNAPLRVGRLVVGVLGPEHWRQTAGSSSAGET